MHVGDEARIGISKIMTSSGTYRTSQPATNTDQPKVIRTDNDPEFAERTMQDWAAKNQVELRFIQPGKPVQNAYIESFNSRFRDECLSQHW